MILNNSHSYFSPFDLSDEIAFLEGMTIVYKSSIDLFFYVVGSAQENEVSFSVQHEYSVYYNGSNTTKQPNREIVTYITLSFSTADVDGSVELSV